MSRTRIASLGVALGMLFSATVALAWTGPTAAAPANNIAAPINTGTTDQVKNAGLSLNALSVFGNSYIQNNLGVGVVSPTQKLDLNGYLRIRTINGEGGTIALDGNNGTNMYVENLNGIFRLVNSPWTAQLFSVDQSGNATAAAQIYSASGGFKFPDATVQTTAAVSPIKAWVNFDGTSCGGSCPKTGCTGTNYCTIRASSNVNYVTREGAGAYTVYFTTPMSDTNYATIGSCSTGVRGISDPTGAFRVYQGTTQSEQIGTVGGNGGGTWMDMSYVSVEFIR